MGMTGEVNHITHSRRKALVGGVSPLPNLAARSLATLAVLYGFLSLLLVCAVELGFISSVGALIFGVITATAQYLVAPWALDLTLRFAYQCRWVSSEELPEHLRLFIERICKREELQFPHFAILDDGSPQAFTYGHRPGNARIVISRGTQELLTPAELEAVVAHELGHICHWDMIVMTIAQIVPLVAYSIYRAAMRFTDDEKKSSSAKFIVAAGAYLIFAISEFVVLWFSRLREYYADQFAAERTENPAALASALVKIGYGLVSGGSSQSDSSDKPEFQREKTVASALGALNIFDRKSSLGLVISTASSAGSVDGGAERVKDALQWDLWNPWALYYELQSTHPLIAKRLERLGELSLAASQEPFVVFDRERPESYWDEFLVDIVVLTLPRIGLLIGLGLLMGLSFGAEFAVSLFGYPLVLSGLGTIIKTAMQYRGDSAAPAHIASLLKQVKISPVRTAFVSLTGSVIGRGVPGLIWSEDFVLRDDSGIIFLDYRQPLPLWDFLFGLLGAGAYTGKQVEVRGWYRRAPVPYLEIASIRELDSGRTRTCYTSLARRICAFACVGAGLALMCFG